MFVAFRTKANFYFIEASLFSKLTASTMSRDFLILFFRYSFSAVKHSETNFFLQFFFITS